MRTIQPADYTYGKLCVIRVKHEEWVFSRREPFIVQPARCRRKLRENLARSFGLDRRQARAFMRRVARIRAYMGLIDGFWSALYPPGSGPLTGPVLEKPFEWFERAPA